MRNSFLERVMPSLLPYLSEVAASAKEDWFFSLTAAQDEKKMKTWM